MSVVFLCGNKACGKTFFLNLLINEYRVEGYDLDAEILKDVEFGTIRELYNDIGEQQFRLEENKVFDQLILKSKKNSVVALGGGALSLIKKCNTLGKTVYLYQQPDVLFARMEKVGLPSFAKTRQDFDVLFKTRDEFYSKNCTCMVDLSKLEEEKVCQTLLEIYLN